MAMSMRQLIEKRAKIVADMRALADAADTAGDTATGLTESQQAAFDALKAALADLETAISNRAAVDDAERRTSGTPLGGTGDRNLDREVRSFSAARAIAAMSGIAGADAGREREVSQEMARRMGRQTEGIIIPFGALAEKRVVTSAGPAAGPVGSPGDNLIQTTLDGTRWIDALRARCVILNHGATLITELTSYLDIPRLVTPAVTQFVAENAPFPISDETWEKISLRPKSAGGIVEISRTMLLASAAPGIEDLVRRDLTAGIARTIDAAALVGTGGVQPLGVLNTEGLGLTTLGANGGPLTFAAIADLIGTVQDANADADGETFMFLGSPRVRRAAAKITDTQNRPLGLDVVFEGFPTAFSNQLPSNGTKGTGSGLATLLFGDVSSVFVGMWGQGVEVLANPFAQDAYARGNVQIRVVCTCDVALRHPQQWAAITDIKA